MRIIVSRTISASRCEINHGTDANEHELGGITWFHSRKAFADNDEDMAGRDLLAAGPECACARVEMRM